MPECIDLVFAKTSPERSFSITENERFGLVFAKTGSINSGISGTGSDSNVLRQKYTLLTCAIQKDWLTYKCALLCLTYGYTSANSQMMSWCFLITYNFFYIKEHFIEDRAKFIFRKSLHRCMIINIIFYSIFRCHTMDIFLKKMLPQSPIWTDIAVL